MSSNIYRDRYGHKEYHFYLDADVKVCVIRIETFVNQYGRWVCRLACKRPFSNNYWNEDFFAHSRERARNKATRRIRKWRRTERRYEASREVNRRR